ncbi:hypothetical protein [Sulfurimonas sp.]
MRKNLTDETELFQKENIAINTNITVEWKLLENSHLLYEKVSQTAIELIEKLDYDTGCVEFAFDLNDKILFFEVNQMAGPLPFTGEDLHNIQNYYDSIMSLLTQN